MQAPSGQRTAPPLHALLSDRSLAGEWVLDPGQSSIGLKNRSALGLIRANGIFGEVSGSITVASASIDTRNTRRDTHLRSADFFDSANYPDITFTADVIRPSGQGVAVTGVLIVRDRTRPLSFDASASIRGAG